jgi:DNA mismatch endonuclease, patch repair protein
MGGDKLTAAERSAQMRRIRKTNTKPEMAVRQLAHAFGLRFRLHRSDLPGTPDLVFPKHRAVVLVHGCFWHQHAGCLLGRKPRSRLDYWLPKLARNQSRDVDVRRRLEELGWRVLVIWECETKNRQAIIAKLQTLLERKASCFGAD